MPRPVLAARERAVLRQPTYGGVPCGPKLDTRKCHTGHPQCKAVYPTPPPKPKPAAATTPAPSPTPSPTPQSLISELVSMIAGQGQTATPASTPAPTTGTAMPLGGVSRGAAPVPVPGSDQEQEPTPTNEELYGSGGSGSDSGDGATRMPARPTSMVYNPNPRQRCRQLLLCCDKLLRLKHARMPTCTHA